MAEITAIVIPADIGLPLRQVQLDTADLSAYQDLVGGYIEAIELFRPKASMYINDHGKIDGLPVNHRATALAAVHNSDFRGRDFVAGDAFVVGPLTATGRDTTVPARYVNLWFEATSFRVQKKVGDSRRWVTKNYRYSDPHVAYVAAVRLARREPEVTEVRVVAR
ncbi:DUF3846 domain-containing protein [Frankia sp. KB5]|uniref:DUF3846 domain-containing protein n=1 Tax=Frankia sp. KB5 TaxID=683318 RepID=UPI001A7E1961|nr:DUF3846 domain-containing protein [Frankia sp. KB5]